LAPAIINIQKIPDKRECVELIYIPTTTAQADPRLALVRNKAGKMPVEIAKSQKVKDSVSLERANAIIRQWELRSEQVC